MTQCNDRLSFTIEPDPDPLNPRAEYDHFGRMVCWHRRHRLGDDHDWPTPEAFAADHPDDSILKRPIFLYDHSGLTVSTRPFHCPWDSGQVGWIFAEKARIRAEFGKQRISARLRARVFSLLEAEVDAFDRYLTGDVWIVTVTDAADAVQDCVSGVLGYDYAEELAVEMVRCASGRS